MSNDDDDKRVKNNVSPTLKPAQVKQMDVAPTGHLGTNIHGMTLQPGGGNKVLHFTMEVAEAAPTPQQAQPEEDTRPIAVKTGDKEVDQDSEAQGQQLKTMEEIREMASTSKNKEEGPKIPQSDYAKAFRQARQDTFDMQNSKDIDID